MEFKEVAAEKDNLEKELLSLIQGKVKEFEEKTGVFINDIKFKMVSKDYHIGTISELTAVKVVIILW
jgi:hypothetical protein